MGAVPENMAYQGETPWHSIGKKIPDGVELTPAQFQKEAGVDWRVKKVKLSGRTSIAGKETTIKTNMNALIREDTGDVLTIVSDSWNALQNDEAFKFFDEYCLAGHLKMETAGQLFGGKYVWALAKVGETFEIVKGDVMERYILFCNPHQFGKVIDIGQVETRVVCENTLRMSLQEGSNRVKVHHGKKFNADDVKTQLGYASMKSQEFKEAAQFLASKNVTVDQMIEFYNRLWNVKDSDRVADLAKEGLPGHLAARKAMEILETQPGAEFAPGTWWSVFNTVSYYTDHMATRSQDRRLQSAWFGSNADLKLRALNGAVKMAMSA